MNAKPKVTAPATLLMVQGVSGIQYEVALPPQVLGTLFNICPSDWDVVRVTKPGPHRAGIILKSSAGAHLHERIPAVLEPTGGPAVPPPAGA